MSNTNVENEIDPATAAAAERLHLVTNIFTTLRLLIWVGIPSWATVQVFEVAAGEETIIRVFTNVFEAFRSDTGSLALCFTLAIWALTERGIRVYKVRYLKGRLNLLKRRQNEQSNN